MSRKFNRSAMRFALFLFCCPFWIYLTDAQSKLCRIQLNGGRLGITLTVGDDWMGYTCAAFQESVFTAGALTLGCTFANGSFSMGMAGGGFPSSNCNWQNSMSNRGKDPLVRQVKLASKLDDAPTKLCAGYSSSNGQIETAIGVDDGWNIGSCKALMVNGPPFLAYPDIRIGCVFNDSFSLTTSSGTLPYPNCGWTLNAETESVDKITLLQGNDLPGYKVCFAFGPSVWDMFTAPESWDAGDCYAYANQVDQTSNFYIGCTFSDGSYSFGGQGGGVPNPNCGW